MLPAASADQRSQGTYDFTWSLPLLRSAAALSSIVATAAAFLDGDGSHGAARAARRADHPRAVAIAAKFRRGEEPDTP
jgi:hypothetical protein